MFVHMMLDAAKLRVLVVGGGAVAARKTADLLAGGAEITLLAPSIQAEAWQDIIKDCRWLAQSYHEEFNLADYKLIIAATNQAELNRQLAERCRRLGILCNCVSAPAEGDVVLPGVVRGKSFSLAVSSGGRLPLLTKRIKQDLRRLLAEYERQYDEATLAWLTELRRRIIEGSQQEPQRKKLLLQRLAAALAKPEQLQKLREQNAGGLYGEYEAVIDWLAREQAGAGPNQTGGGAD